MITKAKTPLAQWQDLSLNGGQIGCWWLGQSGFLLRTHEISLVIDPYLSDSLAVKYQHARFKHNRMMPVPIDPAALSGIDWIFCSHQHTDHMDGGTLPGLVAASPQCRIMAPMATERHLMDIMGMDRARVNLVNPGQHIELHPGCGVDVLASAHEAVECDEAGNSIYLGYILDLHGIRIYHSGDCVPFDGLAEILKRFQVDVALLPVNGRDASRTGHGILGNFHFEEAVSLCGEAGIAAMVPQHFGMFDFNTVDPAILQAKIDGLDGRLQVVVPQMDQALLIDGSSWKPVLF